MTCRGDDRDHAPVCQGLLSASFSILLRLRVSISLVCCFFYPHIFRMHDLLAHGVDGHCPVDLLLSSAAKTGFAWMGANKVGFGMPCLPFGCCLACKPGSSRLALSWLRGRVLGCSITGFERIITTSELFPAEGQR